MQLIRRTQLPVPCLPRAGGVAAISLCGWVARCAATTQESSTAGTPVACRWGGAPHGPSQQYPWVQHFPCRHLGVVPRGSEQHHGSSVHGGDTVVQVAANVGRAAPHGSVGPAGASDHLSVAVAHGRTSALVWGEACVLVAARGRLKARFWIVGTAVTYGCPPVLVEDEVA